MSSNQNEKVDEFLAKIKSLGDRTKSMRAQLGAPVLDRIVERLGRISQKLPQNGDSNPQRQAQTPLKVCPKCGRPFLEDVKYCNCGFSFQEEKRQQQREEFEQEKIERTGRLGVIAP